MAADEPVLLSGGNPQIAKGDGDEFVESYLAAMPGWKQDVGRRLDELIRSVAPDVHTFVRYNTPFYAVTDDWNAWFVSFHCLTKYVKVAFQHGALLDPPPPEPSTSGDVRYWHVFDGDEIGDRFVGWVEQAATTA